MSIIIHTEGKTVTEQIWDHFLSQNPDVLDREMWQRRGRAIAIRPGVVTLELAGLDVSWGFVNRAAEHGKPVDGVRKKLLEKTGD